MAINLSTIRVEQSREIEHMLGVGSFSLNILDEILILRRDLEKVLVRNLHSQQLVLSTGAERERSGRLDQQDFVKGVNILSVVRCFRCKCNFAVVHSSRESREK